MPKPNHLDRSIGKDSREEEGNTSLRGEVGGGEAFLATATGASKRHRPGRIRHVRIGDPTAIRPRGQAPPQPRRDPTFPSVHTAAARLSPVPRPLPRSQRVAAYKYPPHSLPSLFISHARRILTAKPIAARGAPRIDPSPRRPS